MRGARRRQRRRRREEARRGRRARPWHRAGRGGGRGGPVPGGGAAAADSRRGLRGRGFRSFRGAPGPVLAPRPSNRCAGPRRSARPAPRSPRCPGGRWGCEGRGLGAALPEGSPPRGSGRCAPPALSPPVTAAVAAAGSRGSRGRGGGVALMPVNEGKCGPFEFREGCVRPFVHAWEKNTNKRNGDPAPGGGRRAPRPALPRAPATSPCLQCARGAAPRWGTGSERGTGKGRAPRGALRVGGGIGCGRAELSAFERRGNVLRRHFLRCSHRVWHFSVRSFFGNL